jgi:type VI secretion system protein ImpF
MPQHLPPDLWSCLFGEHDGSRNWTPDDLKDAIARDLEDLLNTRCAIPDALLNSFPYTRLSILGYGLTDFSAMCVSNNVDKERICAAVAFAVSRYEPRLADVRAQLVRETSAINRIGFVIHARLKDHAADAAVCFDGALEPSGQRCLVKRRHT